jgi:hypothetical protein
VKKDESLDTMDKILVLKIIFRQNGLRIINYLILHVQGRFQPILVVVKKEPRKQNSLP